MTSFMVLPDTSLASVVVDLDNGDGQITIECQQTAAVTVPIDLEQHSDKIITIVITDDEWNILDEYLYEGPSDYEFNMGESHIIFTIADQCGNAFMDTINVLAADISAPIFICEEDQIVIIEDLSSCSVIANWIIPIAIDNCNEVSLTQTEGPEFGSEVGVGTYVIAYEAEDESGNKSECRFNYTVSPIGVSSLNCLPISLGLDSMCQATITKEAIIGRDLIICAPDFRVEIYASTDTLRGEEFDLSNYFGEAISYVICEPNTDICCENVILLTDSISPIISCLDTVTLSCISDLDNYFPDVVGECGVLTWEVENVAINPVCDTTNIQVEVTRSFVAIDASGNRSLSCIQLIQIEGVNLDTLVADSTLIFPPDTTISCDQFSLDSLSTINFGFPEIDSISIRDGSQPCGLTSFFIDDLFVENGCVKIIKRTWFVTEEICDFHYQEIRGVQTIKIIDSTGPSVSFPQGAITIYTSSHSCSGFLIDLPIEVSDNCQPKESITYQYEYDGQRFNPYDSIEIPFGIHQIRIILQDECRNTSIDSFYVDVQDNKRPVAACLDRTVVTVNEGPVYVSVGSIDIGSYDNCELQSVEIRKLEVTCSESDTTFSDKIEICCTEAGTTIEVLLRTIDHVGNENFCYSLIDVIDKIRPTITCPPNLVVNCGIDLNAGANPDDPYAGLFGGISTTDELPTFTFEEGILLDHDGPLTFGTASDNCVSGLEIKVTTKEEIDNCGQGFIYREFIAIDGHGNESYPCTQTIEIQGGENKDTLVLTWPKAEIVIDGCSSQEALEERDFGRPEIIGGACDLFGISYKDEFFDINEDGACAKLLRTWTLINWCDNDPLSSTQQFTQTVKIIDNESPIITRCSERPVLVFEASDNCNAVMVNLEKNAADGCTPISLIEWSVSIDYFSNQSIDKEVILLSDSTGVRLEEEMPVGTHIIKWKASDLCGNTTECVEELVVENAKAPSLIARGLTTSLHQEGAVEIWASDFDVKVEDNCGGGYDLAIGRAEEAFNPNQNVLTLTCADLGRSLVSIYAYKMLSDSTYNYSVVGVVVNVDDTNNVCENEIEEKEEITGIVYTSNGRSIPDVHLTLRRLRDKQMIREGGTDLNGLYTLGKINENIPYTVRPEKEGDHMNGLNTLDVLKIQRHLLGLAPFDSPYHIIAGDVNRDDRLTAADILEIRRMILQLPSRIFSMDPWRFIDSRILFYDKSQPFLDYLTDDIFIDRVVPSLDLVGVKLGDVDDSANIDYNENGKSRSIAKLMIPNIDFKRGERIEIPISAHSLESIYGIQMAFKIDPSLVIEDVLGPDIVFDISSDNTLYISRSEGHLFSAKETMTIVIKANRDGSLKDLISLDNTNLVGELYDEYLETKQLLLEFTEEERVGFNVVLGANPFIDKTVLEMSGSGLVHLQIVDIKGIVYHQESVLLEGQKTMIPLDRNVFGAPGIYYCRVEKDKEVKVYKLVLLY